MSSSHPPIGHHLISRRNAMLAGAGGLGGYLGLRALASVTPRAESIANPPPGDASSQPATMTPEQHEAILRPGKERIAIVLYPQFTALGCDRAAPRVHQHGGGQGAAGRQDAGSRAVRHRLFDHTQCDLRPDYGQADARARARRHRGHARCDERRSDHGIPASPGRGSRMDRQCLHRLTCARCGGPAQWLQSHEPLAHARCAEGRRCYARRRSASSRIATASPEPA
jgi:hypothetical protein